MYREEYNRSMDLLKTLIAGPENNSIGFFASSFGKDNYKRLFTRDAFWIFMASMLTGDEGLLEGCRESIATLAKYQRDDGAIISNVSPEGKASYGIINPRIDPTTLYIIGCLRFAKRYPEERITEKHLSSISRALNYLENTWEDKDSELLYIPRAGNWADEYLQQGLVLYDQVLWYLTTREYADAIKEEEPARSEYYSAKAERIKNTIKTRFWVSNLEGRKENMHERLKKKFDFSKCGYFIHFYFSPSKDKVSYEYPCGIFDAFGNILAMLAGIPSPEQLDKMVNFIDMISTNKYPLVPAHYPFFPEEIFRSYKLHQYRFKEFIGHFHNGGLWAWYTGPYVAALTKSKKTEAAERFLGGILKANNEIRNGMDFYEYHTGKRAIVYLEIDRENGMDLFVSRMIAELPKASRSTVLIHYSDREVDAENDMEIRSLGLKKEDRIKLSAVGPDAEEVLNKIADLKYGGTRIFKREEVMLKGSKPGGAPYLGVSAAAYIIAYNAFFEGKIIFNE